MKMKFFFSFKLFFAGNLMWQSTSLFLGNWGTGERPPNIWRNKEANIWARLTSHFRVQQKSVPVGEWFNTVVVIERVNLFYVQWYGATGDKFNITPCTIEECWLKAQGDWPQNYVFVFKNSSSCNFNTSGVNPVRI